MQWSSSENASLHAAYKAGDVSMFGTMAVRDAIKIKTSLKHDINYLKKLLDPISNIKLEVIQSKESKEAL